MNLITGMNKQKNMDGWIHFCKYTVDDQIKHIIKKHENENCMYPSEPKVPYSDSFFFSLLCVMSVRMESANLKQTALRAQMSHPLTVQTYCLELAANQNKAG